MSFLKLALLLSCFAQSLCNERWKSGLSETFVRHRRTAESCYHLPQRKTNVVITTLLPDGVLTGKGGAFIATFRNLAENNPADIVFFNPNGWPEQKIQDLRQQIGAPDLQVLCIAQHDWAQQHKDRPWEYVMRDWNGPGYRSMCFWNSRRLLQVLYRMGFEWVIRIDTDSVFPDTVPYNLMHAMEEVNAVYGFRAVSQESSIFSRALAEAARYWLTSEKITPTYILDHCNPPTIEGLSSTGWNHTIIFNNFYITKLSWWMQPHVRAWLLHLERLRGAYKHRWGDAPIHTITLGMFLHESQLAEFGFTYAHDVGSGRRSYPAGVFATSWPHLTGNRSTP